MRAMQSASLLATALLLCPGCRSLPGTATGTRSADLVVYGRVWTGDSANPWAGAVAVAGDTIVAVGDSATLAKLIGSGTRVIHNGKAMVTPGFIDGHVHLLSGGFQIARVNLRDASSPAEFTRRLKEHAARLPPGEWITGGDWDHERWAGAPLPDRSWIDSVTPNNPVFVNRLDGHMSLANTAALRLARIGRTTRDIPGGTIVRNPRSGEPTGVLKDNARDLVEQVRPIASPAQSDSALARAMSWAAAHGVTGVSTVSDDPGSLSTAGAWRELATLKRARRNGSMLTRVSVYVSLQAWRAMADTLRVQGPGDGWLRSAGVKGFVDGSLGSTTALFYEPYQDAPGSLGLLVTPEDSLRTWIGGADSAGLQVVVHAIGERANGLLLDIYDSVARAHGPRNRRFRIEHAQHLRRPDIARLAHSGVIASMQPYHAIDDGRWAEKRIGPERIKTTYAFRSLLDDGARLTFGSDWTVAPLDPLLGIYAAVTRRTLDGKNPNGWVPEEKITVEEALRAYTTSGAYGVYAERSRGKLAPGYQADLVLLDQDLTTIPPERIDRVRVRTTLVGGKVVFQRP
ncbi:MAG: amidohydrolase [Gemmatimonadales bacterium]